VSNQNSEQQGQQQEAGGVSAAQDFNLGLLVWILKKNWIWIVVITALTFTIAHVYLRYTPDIYESSTELMLVTKEKQQILGVGDILSDNSLEINREIQLLKSNLLLDRVIDSLPLEITYYQQGRSRFVTTELYKRSPVRVESEIHVPTITNVPIQLLIIDESTYQISYEYNNENIGKEKKFGEAFSTPHFTLVIYPEEPTIEKFLGKEIFFKIQTKEQVVNELKSKIEVSSIDKATRSFKILYQNTVTVS
jgi:hypothetical protein